MTSLETIRYAPVALGQGIMARPDSRAVMLKAVAGHPVEVTSGNDYINLYHVFERLIAGQKRLANLRLVRRQVDTSKWIIRAVRQDATVPEETLSPTYDPKRGRYKRYAERLAAGETIHFAEKAEAMKARRAWQLYVPREKRASVRSTIAKNRGKFAVSIRRSRSA